MTDHNPVDLVTAAADLGRRDTVRELDSTTVEVDTALYVTKLRSDEHVEVTNLERLLEAPLRPRGTSLVYHPDDFAEYVNRLGDDAHTTVWADPDAGTLIAVFDDHANSEDAGWRSHTAKLLLQPDPDWQAWLKRNNTLLDQAAFADHLEDLAHTVVDPDAATMIEIAKTFNAKRSVNFSSAVRNDSGDVAVTYEETTHAKTGQKGQIEIPAQFTVRIAPFLGTDPAEVQARLRYRINEGRLGIGYALLRPDLVRRDIIATLIATVRERIIPMPVFMGVAPAEVQAAI